ncbi:MAG: hypothetical protein LBH20_05200 [Treponema sp.]|nr:hypothetical protein [Treponema sp.]
MNLPRTFGSMEPPSTSMTMRNQILRNDYGMEVLGFYCPYPRYCFPLVSSGREPQNFFAALPALTCSLI